MSPNAGGDHSDAEWLDLLRANQGFAQPDRWIEYAKSHSFKRVRATKVAMCPDCEGPQATTIGQYVYYSTLISLRMCGRCRLIYSDTRIDPAIARSHFDVAYSNEQYFQIERQRIYRQIAKEVATRASAGAAILDIGGAKGHLMATVRQCRPDVEVTLNDLSREKCEWAESHYGFRTICSSAADLSQHPDRFDLITAIDVLYYEPELARFWSGVPRLLRRGGILIVRVPNREVAIRASWLLLRARRRDASMCTEIRYFNPEHLYAFSRVYLIGRLRQLGFRSVQILPSARLGTGMLGHLHHDVARVAWLLSAGRLVLTPGMLVIARKS
jgi:SAM-dependent methyltransferase